MRKHTSPRTPAQSISDQGLENPKLGNRAPRRNEPQAPTSGSDRSSRGRTLRSATGSLRTATMQRTVPATATEEWDYFRDTRAPGQHLNGSPDPSLTPARVTLSVRMRFDPIRGLKPERLVAHLDQWQLGFFRSAGMLFDAMERRDYQIKTVASKRRKSIARLGYDIVTVDEVPAGLEELAAEQQQFLKHFWDNISVTAAMDADERGGFALLVRQMMDAVGKKYAVHEIVWKISAASPEIRSPSPRPSPPGEGGGASGGLDAAAGSNAQLPGEGTGPTGSNSQRTPEGGAPNLTAHFIFCPVWWFEGTRGKLRFLQSEFQVYGNDMFPGDWLVTVHEGVMEACSLLFLFKHLPLKSWLAFLDKFGMPGLHGKTDAAYGSKEWNDFVQAVKVFSEDWAAVTNRSGEISLVEAGRSAGGEGPFAAIVEKMDKAITTLWLGADLGTSSKKDHTGASLQGDDTAKLEIDDTQLISETLNSQVSDLALEWRFGPNTPRLAYLKIRVAEEKDLMTDQAIDAWLVNAGFPMTVGQAAERYGRPLPEGAERNELLKPVAAPASGLSKGAAE